MRSAAYLWGGADGGGANEYGKPNATRANGGASETVAPALRGVWAKGAQVLVELGFPERLHAEYGAPAAAWLRVNVSSAADARLGRHSFEITSWIGVTASSPPTRPPRPRTQPGPP